LRAGLRTRRAAGLLVAVAVSLTWFAGAASAAAHVNVITIDGSINPASSDFLQSAIQQSESEEAQALLIELDTPGGLLSSTKDIIQAMLNANVPIIVFVAPKGAWAASAGTFITLAGHIAAMAPGTSIGAASPVSVSGGGGARGEDNERQDVSAEKAEKFTMAFMESIAKERDRNVEWAVSAVREAEAIPQDKALELGVIDLIANDRRDLLRQIDGQEIEFDNSKVTLEVAEAEIRVIEMTQMTKLFSFLASPDVAMLLVMAGLLGLYIEFQQPGMLVPGIAGAACLVLAAFAFQILPFSWIGLVLILVGMGLLVAEMFFTSFGVLFTAGILCFLVGGSMLFDMPEVSDLTISFWTVLVPIVAGFGLAVLTVVVLVSRSMFRKQTAGVDEMLGMVGRAHTGLSLDGKVFVRGEYWTASADQEIAAGESVEVTAVDGMRLRVTKAKSAGVDDTSGGSRA
jgi:membrane-bound serine protease (ClpP class)